MKGLRFIVMSLFLHFSIAISFAQKEANIWYFGNYAGLDFISGSPVALINGQLSTTEGCASISNSQGNLLFYTDGITIWNKAHQVMLNGTGLYGDYSSTNSAIIVPKPNDPNIYYVFTLGNAEPDGVNNGLQYSEVNMTLDGGLGGVTSSKNIILHQPSTEKMTAVKVADENAYWVISHKLDSDTFLSYKVANSGIETTPVASAVGRFISHYYYGGLGTMKVSPDGTKLAMAIGPDLDVPNVEIFDFDAVTGKITNPKEITLDDYPYGIEFSPDGNLLYVSSGGINTLQQFNLNAGTIAQVQASAVTFSTAVDVGAIQLATNGKIYFSIFGSTYLGVINVPNVPGFGCNFVEQGVYLGGKTCALGLPPFIQSFFSVGILSENVCFGEVTQFHLNGNNAVDSVVWDFGDPTTGVNNMSTILEPSHVFSAPGTYTVTLTATKGSHTDTETATVTIYEQPTATQPPDMLVCDDDNDGIAFFDLTSQNDAILNGQDPSVFEVFYYNSMDDDAVSLPSYWGVLQGENINVYARVKNRFNPSCEAMTGFSVQLSSKSNLAVTELAVCDNTSAGTDDDGIIEWDLTQKEAEILNGQDAQNFAVSYFTDALLQNQIPDPTQYQNTNPTETIYVVVSNNFSSYCSGETQIDLEVYPLPVVSPMVDLKQCDDDIDGFSPFNLEEAINKITPNGANETVTFYTTETDAVSGNMPILNPTIYINQTVSFDKVWARIENELGCFKTSQINLTVTTTQIPNSFIREFRSCEDLDGDSINGISVFNFSSVQSEIEAIFPSGQELVITYYRNEANALAEEDQISDISNYTNIGYPNSQQIFVRVDSKIDNDCLGLGSHINLIVEPMPDFTVETPLIVCSSDPTFKVILDPIETDTNESYDYSWVLNGVEVGTSATLEVSTPGTYSVTLTKTNGIGCSTTEEIFVNASELATITSDDIKVVELSDNNSITIDSSNLGIGDYEFALDNSFGSYQDEPYFDHVSAGLHTLYVRDKKGCGTTELKVFILGFPKFFTPNDDGFHDTWNIVGLRNDYTRNSRVYIFDRYGKLLIQLDPKGANWDGTFNGEKLSSSDYWFVAELHNVDGTLTTYRGHFSLVR